MLTPEKIVETLNLKPHPKEGGHFAETYRSDEFISLENLPSRYNAKRSLSTAIYYLLTPHACSRLHRLRSDEIFHFYIGGPVLMLQLYPNGLSKTFILGSDILKGHYLQLVVPRNVWQGALLIKGSSHALLGTTVAPGFDYNDYESAERERLIEQYPDQKDLIIQLTI